VTGRIGSSPDSGDLVDRLRLQGLEPASWSNGPRDVYAAHEHGYDKVLVVSAGSVTFGLPASGERVELALGDRLELPAGTIHDALVGPEGVTCLEAHIPRGHLASVTRNPAGTW
jgi:uncharacterized protein YjlB